MTQDKKNNFDNQISENNISSEYFDTEREKSSPDIEDDDDTERNLNFIIKIYGRCEICIYKPLIPLKLILFLWFGAGSALGPFIVVYFKQRGVSLGEISTVYILSPIAQFLGTLLSGIIADKIGKSKPILVINLILTIILLVGILFVPRLNTINCDSQPINLKCHPKQFDRLITKTSCDVLEDVIEINSCNVQCPDNVTEHCNGQNLICDILAGREEKRNFSLSIHINGSSQVKDRCYYNVSFMSHENETYSWCDVPHKMYCRVSCTVNSGLKCSKEVNDRDMLMIITMALYILLMVAYSNCYRVMDVTAMALVKEHNSDFGRERFFSIAGILVFSPFAGYLVGATSSKGGENNYNPCFYLFIAMVLLILMIVYKLDVTITSPGKRMVKKTFMLLKNPDVLSFALIVLVLGTAWSFTKIFLFWYLEEMKPPGILLGLISAISALYGLPFLLTSGWWVNKIGATKIFILALLGYIVYSLGYSYLYDPWISLILEATNILTYHLLWVAVITHSHELAPEGLRASVIATAGSLHYHIGKSTGTLIGGLIMNTYGGRAAFRVIAVICAVFALIYSVYLVIRHKCYGKKLSNTNEQIEEEMKPNGETQALEIIQKI